jgi:hypothetical protein
MHDRSGASLERAYPHVPFRPRSIRCACGASAASRKVCRRGLSEGGASEAEERYLRHRHHFLAERWRSMPPAEFLSLHSMPVYTMQLLVDRRVVLAPQANWAFCVELDHIMEELRALHASQSPSQALVPHACLMIVKREHGFCCVDGTMLSSHDISHRYVLHESRLGRRNLWSLE